MYSTIESLETCYNLLSSEFPVCNSPIYHSRMHGCTQDLFRRGVFVYKIAVKDDIVCLLARYERPQAVLAERRVGRV